MDIKEQTPHHKFSLRHEHCFIKIAIKLEDNVISIDPKSVKFAIDSTLKTVFGAVDLGKHEVDILQVSDATIKDPITAILRTRQEALRKVWGAMTMCSTVDNKICKLEVLQVGSNLLELASSRQL